MPARVAELEALLTLKDEMSGTIRALRGRADKLEKTLGGLGVSTKLVSGGFLKLAGTATGVAAGLGVVYATIKPLVDKSNEYNALLAQMEGLADKTGRSIGFLAGQVEALKDSTDQSSESLVVQQNELLKNKNISEGMFATIISLSDDAAAGLGEKPITALKKLAKALDDPSEGIKALKGLSIDLSREQESLVIALDNSGQTLAAQTLILREVESAYGGLGDKMDSTARGSAKKLGVAISELRREVGERFAPAINKSTKAITGIVQWFTKWLSKGDQAKVLLEEFRSEVDRTSNAASGLIDRSLDPLTVAMENLAIMEDEAGEALAELVRAEESSQNTHALRVKYEELSAAVDFFREKLKALRSEVLEQGQELANIVDPRTALKERLEYLRQEIEKRKESLEATKASRIEREKDLVLIQELVDGGAEAVSTFEAAWEHASIGADEFHSHLEEILLLTESIESLVSGIGESFRQFGIRALIAGHTVRTPISGILSSFGRVSIAFGEMKKASEAYSLSQDKVKNLTEQEMVAKHLFGAESEFALQATENLNVALIEQAKYQGEASNATANFSGAIVQLIASLGSMLGAGDSQVFQGAMAGAQVGMMTGSKFGGLWGAAIGAVVGVVIESLNKVEQTFADASTQAGRLQGQIHEHAQGLDSATEAVLYGAIDVVNSILDQFGATLESWETFGVQIRDTGDGIIKVWVNDILYTVESVEEAIGLIATKILYAAEISGISDTVRAAIRAAQERGDLQQLQQLLADAYTIDMLDVPEIMQGVRAKINEFNQLLQRAFRELGGEGIDTILLGSTGFVATFRSAVEEFLGVTKPLEEQTRDRQQGLLAEIALGKAQLLVLKSQIEAQAAANRANWERVRGDLEATRALQSASLLRRGIDIEYAQSVLENAGIVGLAATTITGYSAAMLEAMAAIDAALAELELLEAQLEGGFAQALNAARRASNSAANASRREAAERMRSELEIREARARGNDSLAERLEREAENVRWIESVVEALGEEARSRAEEIVILEESRRVLEEIINLGEGLAGVAEPFRDIIETSGMTDIERTFYDIARQAEEAGEEIARMVEESEGALGEEGWRAWLDIMEAVEIQRQQAIDSLREEGEALSRTLEGYRSIGPYVDQMMDLDREFQEHREHILDLIAQYEAAGLSTEELRNQLASLGQLQSEAALAIQWGFLATLDRMGVEIPGFAEAMIKMQFAMARAQAIALFSSAQTTTDWARHHISTFMTVVGRIIKEWKGWGDKMLKITLDVTQGIVRTVGSLLGALIKPIKGKGPKGPGEEDDGEDIIPGLDLTLDELLELIDAAEQAALDALNAIPPIDGLSDSISGLSEAASAAQRLVDMLFGGANDPFSQIREALELLNIPGIAAELRALGYTVEEIMEALGERTAEILEQALSPLEALRRRILGTTGGQAANLGALQSEVAALMARVRGGDLSAAGLLAQRGGELLSLLESMGGFQGTMGRARLLEQLNELLGGSFMTPMGMMESPFAGGPGMADGFSGVSATIANAELTRQSQHAETNQLLTTLITRVENLETLENLPVM